MKIAFDAKRAFYNRSGLGNYSRSTIEILKKYYPENLYSLYTPNIANSIDFDREGFDVVFPLKKWFGLYSSYWRTFDIVRQLKSDGIEIYHGLSNEIPHNIHKSGIKSVVTIHDLIFIRYPEYYSRIDAQIYKKKFQYACYHANRIIAISNQTKKDIIQFFNCDPDKIDVVFQGCDKIFKEKVSDEQKTLVKTKYSLPEYYILYVGTIEKRKNLLSLVKALSTRNIDKTLVVVGKATPYINEIHDFINKNNMQERVKFLHDADFMDFPAIYQMSKLFVYPSIFEGFGIPILEALTSGVPVITSQGSCFAEAGGEHTQYTEPYNIEQLAEAINKILSDDELYKNMVKQGLLYAQKFSDDIIAENLMNVYNSI